MEIKSPFYSLMRRSKDCRARRARAVAPGPKGTSGNGGRGVWGPGAPSLIPGSGSRLGFSGIPRKAVKTAPGRFMVRSLTVSANHQQVTRDAGGECKAQKGLHLLTDRPGGKKNIQWESSKPEAVHKNGFHSTLDRQYNKPSQTGQARETK